jgi:MazG family protein
MADSDNASAEAFREFVAIIRALRTPGTGCPWDLEQDHRTLRPYLLEEAHEVLEAIDAGHDPALRDELGDLLLQVVLHAQVAADRSAFTIADVLRGIAEKMVRRHPHVFGTEKVTGADDVRRNWEQIKAGERGTTDPLGRVPLALPALARAQRLGEKASRAGVGPSSVAAALDAVRRNVAELETQATSDPGQPLGDLLFTVCQLARLLGVNAEDSLREANRRFVDDVGGR